MNIDQAIEKARKLLALATSDNPNEAAAAAAQAQAILDKHKISRAVLAIDNAVADIELDEPVENFSDKDAPLDAAKTVATWKGIIANVIAQVNGCRVYTSRRGHGRAIEIVGRASDVDKVRYLYAYLVHETDRLCNRDGKGCGRVWRNNYRHGVVDTVGKALRAARQTVVDELRHDADADSRALVRIDKALERIDANSKAVDRFCRDNLRLRTSSSSARGDRGVRQRGQEAGREIKIGGARGALGAGRRQIRGS